MLIQTLSLEGYLLNVKDIFMLNILKMYCKYQEKSLYSSSANMFSAATCATNHNLHVTKSLPNVDNKTISDDKCIRSDLPKEINETDKVIMDKIATHSYNLHVTKSLPNVDNKTISDDKCIHSDLPKEINETDKDIMDKIATHSYQAFAFYFKRVTFGKYKQNCHIQNLCV